MPDITMCTNESCKLDCYRRLAKPSEFLQSYSDFKPEKEGFCLFFLE